MIGCDCCQFVDSLILATASAFLFVLLFRLRRRLRDVDTRLQRIELLHIGLTRLYAQLSAKIAEPNSAGDAGDDPKDAH